MNSLIKEKEQGFTLLEVVLGLAISLILLGAAVKVFNLQRKALTMQEQVTEMRQNIRAAMDMIVREAEMAGYDPCDANFNGIGTNTTSLVQILADLNGNGTTTGDTNEDISYRYYDASDATYPLQLKRKTGSGSYQPFAENIQAFSLAYLDSNGATTSNPSSIRQIQITITGRTEKIDVDSGDYKYGTLTSSVTPKNLAY